MIGQASACWLDFTGIYREQKSEQYYMDLGTVRGTCGYCDETAAAVLRQRLLPCPLRLPAFLDNGNYHYLSLFRMEQLTEPFQLLLFDHHPDCMPAALSPSLLSCGSWVYHALRSMPLLSSVTMFGPNAAQLEEAVSYIPEQERRDLMPRIRLAAADTSFLPASSLPAFYSIDKDILSADELKTNWDQGDLSADGLLQLLTACRTQLPTAGCDICGEPEPDADTADMEKSRGINRRLLEWSALV